MDLAFFGHHKCASTSTEAVCFDLCNKLGYYPVYKKTAFTKSLKPFLKQPGRNFIISINSEYSNLDSHHQLKGFHLIRDPRDICVSGYFSHLYSHQLDGFDRLEKHRKRLQNLSFEEGLFLEFDFTAFWLKHIESWNYNDERILEMKLEQFISAPEDSWMKVFNWLGIKDENNKESDTYLMEKTKTYLNYYFRLVGFSNVFLNKGLSNRLLQEVIDKYSFEKMSKGRKAGKEDIKSHYRKGKAKDWQNYFSSAHKAYFKEKYGKLLMKLGYEKDLNW